MANVNLAALDMFRTAKDWTADSIANLDGSSIKNVGEYGGAFSALSRSSTARLLPCLRRWWTPLSADMPRRANRVG